jgi:hypothetical protein
MDKVVDQEQALLGARKLLRQGHLKRPTAQTEFEGHLRGY